MRAQTPSAHTAGLPYAKRSDPNSARVRCLFLLDSMPALGNAGHGPKLLCRHRTQDISFSSPIRFRCGFDTWKSVYFLHAESAQRHIARVDPVCGRGHGPPGLGEAFMKNTPLPPTLLRHVAGVPLMLVMRALAVAGTDAETRN